MPPLKFPASSRVDTFYGYKYSFILGPMSLLSLKEKADRGPVYQTVAAYYNPVSKRWQKGVFTLHRRYVEFLVEDEDQSSTPFHLTLPLRSVCSIRRKTSLFIYAALVIEIGSEAHWFSSFENRDSAYNMLELFWRDSLLSRSVTSSGLSPTSLRNASPLGKQILSVLRESEDTLTSTASELEEQGKQLNEAQEAIDELNADLNAAEKFLKSADFSAAAHTSKDSGPEAHPAVQNAKKILSSSRKKKYKVTFTSSETDDGVPNSWEKGFIVVADDLQLVDEQENTRFHIPLDELQELVVISPWEISIVRMHNGKETSYNVMCPMLLQLHKILSSSTVFGERLSYKDDVEFNFRRKSHSASSSTSSISSSASSANSSTTSLSPDIPQIIQQVQKVQSSGSLMQDEAQEISSVLNNLQNLATEVNKEQECQMEKIKQLIDDVNKTELRMSSDNKALRRLS